MKYCPNCAGPKAPWRKFCSTPCGREFRKKVSLSYRHYRQSACERCGSVEKLHVHHKNEDIRYNNPENLETLCEKCHRAHHAEQLWRAKQQSTVRRPRKAPNANRASKRFQGHPFKQWKARHWGVEGILDKIALQRSKEKPIEPLPTTDIYDLIMMAPPD